MGFKPSSIAPFRRGPWSFWKAAVRGGGSRWSWMLILAWIAFDAVSGTAWAFHLRTLVQSSALPNYWGEMLTARDVWELLEHGGLKDHPVGFWVPLLGLACLVWVLWVSWKVQTQAVSLPARFQAWFFGFLETLLIGIPIVVLGYGVSWILEGLAGTGIQGLGWLNLLGGTLFKLSCVSTVMLQWWLCRIDRAGAKDGRWHMGSIERLLEHLHDSLERLWLHPVQWGVFLVGGTLVRIGLHAAVYFVAWKLGGGSTFRVWLFLALQLVAAGTSAWLLGWFLRLSACYWQEDVRHRKERRLVDEALDPETEHGIA